MSDLTSSLSALPVTALCLVIGFREAKAIYTSRMNGKNGKTCTPPGWHEHVKVTMKMADRLSDDPPRKQTETLEAIKRGNDATYQKLCEIKAAIVNGNSTRSK